MSSTTLSGIALLCDQNGIIDHIIYDELGAASTVRSGQHFPLTVDRASMGKALNFLITVQNQQAAFDWEINIPLTGEIASLHFSGVEINGQLLLVGARSHDNALRLYEELALIANSEANVVRQTVKKQVEQEQEAARHVDELMNRLSAMNNELASLQRELSKKNDELERLNALKNQFLGIAAHDLRSPLSLIMAYSDFLIQEVSPQLASEHNEFLNIIYESSRFMLNLVNDLLDVSVIESGHLEMKWQPVDLRRFVSQIVTLNRPVAAQKQIVLEFTASEPIQVWCDAGKIQQVLSNLLTNAIKFSFPDGPVAVRLERVGEEAVIAVQNHGQGIPANELDKLFKPFSRTSVRSTGGEKGTGLGLLIARRIVEAHKGRIWVESAPDASAIFSVALPLGEPTLEQLYSAATKGAGR